jgi:FtsZ-interacting cell division protein YlmF
VVALIGYGLWFKMKDKPEDEDSDSEDPRQKKREKREKNKSKGMRDSGSRITQKQDRAYQSRKDQPKKQTKQRHASRTSSPLESDEEKDIVNSRLKPYQFVDRIERESESGSTRQKFKLNLDNLQPPPQPSVKRRPLSDMGA